MDENYVEQLSNDDELLEFLASLRPYVACDVAWAAQEIVLDFSSG